MLRSGKDIRKGDWCLAEYEKLIYEADSDVTTALGEYRVLEPDEIIPAGSTIVPCRDYCRFVAFQETVTERAMTVLHTESLTFALKSLPEPPNPWELLRKIAKDVHRGDLELKRFGEVMSALVLYDDRAK